MALDLDQVEKNIKKLRSLLRKAGKRPSVKRVHQLRSRTRRVEAAFKALGIHSNKNERRLLKRLERVRKKAGKVRDMDVLKKDLAGISLNGEGRCQLQLVHYLGRRRYRHANRLRRWLRQHRSEARRRLKGSERRVIRLREKQSHSPARPSRGRTRTAATALQLSAELADPPVLNQKNLHEYRLKIKELRDVLCMGRGNSDPELVAMLGDCKDAIGEWHDWGELEKIAKKRLDGKSSREGLKKIAAIRQKKYEVALAIANQVRKRYAAPQGASATRGSALTQPEPMLKAAAALVQ